MKTEKRERHTRTNNWNKVVCYSLAAAAAEKNRCTPARVSMPQLRLITSLAPQLRLHRW